MMTERRLHPRYFLNFPLVVQVESRGELKVFESESVNLSKSAIEIRGDGAMVAAFMAQSAYPHFCELGFRLPGHGEEMVMECQLITHRRLSQHCYQLVLQFSEFVSGNAELLAQHLEGMQQLAEAQGSRVASGG